MGDSDWDEVLRAELGRSNQGSQGVLARGNSSSSNLSETAAALGPEHPEPVFGINPAKRGRGRPRGVTKSVRDSQGPDVYEDDAAVVAELNGSAACMERLRAMRRCAVQPLQSSSGTAVANDEDTFAVTPYGPKGLLTSLGSAIQKTLGSAILAVWGQLSKCKQLTGVQDVPQDNVVSHMLEGDVLTCSASSVAKMLDSSRTVVQNALLAAGSATLEGAGLLWSVMLTSLNQLQETTSNTKPLMFCVNVKFDETPTKVRVASLDVEADDSSCSNMHGRHILVPRAASSGQHLQRFLQLLQVAPKVSPQSATHAKVLQTQIQLGVLYQKCAPDGSKSHVWVTGEVPCALQAMDRSTGEAQLSCVMESLGTVPELKRLAHSFPLQVRTITTDKYGANARTEEGLRGAFPTFTSTHLACDVHRCSNAINNMLKRSTCKNDMSGLLNTSLALSELGSVKKLRDALTNIFFAEMEVVHSEPPTEATKQYREHIFDLYLPVTGVFRSVRKLNLKRRFILSSVLNGDIMTPKITHYCQRGCCQNKEETLCNAALFLTWALLPFACPVLCRKSWIGQLGNLRWVAVLEAHHGLFVKLMSRFFGRPSAPVRDDRPEPGDEWLAVLNEEVSAAHSAQADVVDARGPEDRGLSDPAQPAAADAAGESRNLGVWVCRIQRFLG